MILSELPVKDALPFVESGGAFLIVFTVVVGTMYLGWKFVIQPAQVNARACAESNAAAAVTNASAAKMYLQAAEANRDTSEQNRHTAQAHQATTEALNTMLGHISDIMEKSRV